MKLHHHILHFILSPFGPFSLSLSLSTVFLLPPLTSSSLSDVVYTWADSWLLTQHTMAAATPALLCRQMSGNYAKTLAINKCKKATTASPLAPWPTCPPAWDNWLPPAISVITNPNPNPNPKSAPALPLLPHLPDLHSLAKREREGERGGRGATHNNPQHSHNRYLVIVVGLYALSQLIYINRHAKLAQSQFGRETKAHTHTHRESQIHTQRHISAHSHDIQYKRIFIINQCWIICLAPAWSSTRPCWHPCQVPGVGRIRNKCTCVRACACLPVCVLISKSQRFAFGFYRSPWQLCGCPHTHNISIDIYVICQEGYGM